MLSERLSLSRSISIELLPSLRRSAGKSFGGDATLTSEAVASCVGRAAATLQRAVEETSTDLHKESLKCDEGRSTSPMSALSAVASLIEEETPIIFSQSTSPLRSSAAVSSNSTLASDRQLTQKATASLIGMRHFGIIPSDSEALRSWLAVLLLARLRSSAHTLTSILRVSSSSLPRFLESVDSCFFSLDLRGTGTLGLQELCVLFAALISSSKQISILQMVLSDANLFLSSAASLGAIIASPFNTIGHRGERSSPRSTKKDSENTLMRDGESALLQRMGVVSLPIWRAFLTISCASETVLFSPSSNDDDDDVDEPRSSALKSVVDLKDRIEQACAAINGRESLGPQRYGLHELWSRSCEDACVSAMYSASSHSSSLSSSTASKDTALLKSAAQNKDVSACAHQALLSTLLVVGGGALVAVAREGRGLLDEASIGSVTASVVSSLGTLPHEALILSRNDIGSSDLAQTALTLASNIAHTAVLGAIRAFLSGLPASIALAIEAIDDSLWQGQEADTSVNVAPSLPSFAIQAALTAAQRAVTMKDEKMLQYQATNVRSIINNNSSTSLRHSFSEKRLSNLSLLSIAQPSSFSSSHSSPFSSTSLTTSKLMPQSQPLQPLGTWEAPPRSPLPSRSPLNKEMKSVSVQEVESSVENTLRPESNEEILNTSLKSTSGDVSNSVVPTLMISIDELIEAEEEASAIAAASSLNVLTKTRGKNADINRKRSIDVDPSIYTIDDVGDVLSLSNINSVGEIVTDDRTDHRQSFQSRELNSSSSLIRKNSGGDRDFDAPPGPSFDKAQQPRYQQTASQNLSADEIESVSKLRIATELALLPTSQSSFSSSPLPSPRSPTGPRSVLGTVMSPNSAADHLLKSPNDDETEDAPLEFQPIRLANVTTTALSSSSSLGMSPPQRGSQLSGSRLSTRGLSMSSLVHSPRYRGEKRKENETTSAQAVVSTRFSQSSIPPHLVEEYHTLLVRQARLLDRVLDPHSSVSENEINKSSNQDGFLTREGLLLALRVVRDRVKVIDSLAASHQPQTVDKLQAGVIHSNLYDKSNPFSSPPGLASKSSSAVDISRFFPKSPAGIQSSAVSIEGASRSGGGPGDIHRLDVDNGDELLMRITSRLPHRQKNDPIPPVPPSRSRSRSNRNGRSESANKRSTSVGSVRVRMAPTSSGVARAHGRSSVGGDASDRSHTLHTLSEQEKSTHRENVNKVIIPQRSRSRSSARDEQVLAAPPHKAESSRSSSRARSRSRDSNNQTQQKSSSSSTSTSGLKEKTSIKGRGRAMPAASNHLTSVASSPRQMTKGDSRRSTPRSSETTKSPGRLLWQSIFPDEVGARLPAPPSSGWASALTNGDATPPAGTQSHGSDILLATRNSQSKIYASNDDGFVLTPPSAPLPSTSSSLPSTHLSSFSAASVNFPALFSSPSISQVDSSTIKAVQNQLQHQQQVSAYMSHPRLRRFMRGDGHLIGSSPPTASIKPVPPPVLPLRAAHSASVSSINRLHSGLPTNMAPRRGK